MFNPAYEDDDEVTLFLHLSIREGQHVDLGGTLGPCSFNGGGVKTFSLKYDTPFYDSLSKRF